jgi:hypothetical protein
MLALSVSQYTHIIYIFTLLKHTYGLGRGQEMGRIRFASHSHRIEQC